MARITIIAAVAENGVIGVDNDLPWRCPTDFAFFKHTTMGKPLVMGPAGTKTAGIWPKVAAAMISPGTILSQTPR